MESPDDWPSLADELHLAEELLGPRRRDAVASWLESEAARVDDPDFARRFSDHIDLPGVAPEDYLHRRIRTSSGTLLAGIRFKGRDISRPFVEIIAHSFDELDDLRACVRDEWSMFAPSVLRLWARPDHLNHAGVLDYTIYLARHRDMRPAASHVWLQPFDSVDAAGALVRARYQQLATDDPELARNITPGASAEDLRQWHESGQLHAIRTYKAVVGLLAVLPGRYGWIEGDEINEEVISVNHRGQGYAVLAQAAWSAHCASDCNRLLIGTIERRNIASRKTAERAGRRRVLDTVFVPLESS